MGSVRSSLGRRSRLPRLPFRRSSVAGWSAIVGGLAAVAAAYLLGVVSISGRRLDVAWARAAELIAAGVRPEMHAIMAFGSIPAVIVGASLLVAFCLRRGRRAEAVGSILLVSGAELITELIKATLPRPGGENTLPSGHITLITALMLAIVLVSPAHRRFAVAMCGSVPVVFSVLAVWVIGWHRPSDVVAAFGVVVACGGALTSARAALQNRTQSPPSSAHTDPDHPVS